MPGVLEILCGCESERPIFERGGVRITAGDIRATAEKIIADLDSTSERLYLHTNSAAIFTAGLLACARLGRAMVCPAHVQPDYLKEIGADEALVLSDRNIAVENFRLLKLVEGAPSNCWQLPIPLSCELHFYTSGATGSPKCVHKNIGQLNAEVSVLDELWGAQAGVTLATVSHQHIYGMLFRIFWPIASGRVSTDFAVEYWEQLSGAALRGATLVTSPAHLSRLPESFSGERPALIFSSGAVLGHDAAMACESVLGSVPVEVLGSTETGGIAWRRQGGRETPWTPMPSVQVDADPDGLLTVVSPFTGQTAPLRTNDKVELFPGGFRLRGRADVVVKVEGVRVSLSRVQEVLQSLPFVSDAAVVDLPARKGSLGAVVELTDAGADCLAKRGSFRLSRELRRQLASRLAPAERPKHWRFEAIPTNAQGKRVQSMLRAAFEAPAESHFGRSRILKLDADGAEIELALMPDMVWFDGHFPGEPVLPGIAQVHMAANWAQHVWNWRAERSNLTRLKFRRVLRPGNLVRLSLTRDMQQDRLKFSYRLKDVVASEGVIGGLD